MIKAVVFDLDDTLISEKKYIESGYQHISKLLSNRFNKDEQELYQLLTRLFYEKKLKEHELAIASTCVREITRCNNKKLVTLLYITSHLNFYIFFP